MIVLVIVLIQLVAATVILTVLWGLLKRELVQAALAFLEQSAVRTEIVEVAVVTAGGFSFETESRLRALLAAKFPSATVNLVVNNDIRGGLVIQAGDLLLDYSLLTRIKHLLGQKDG